MKGSVIISDCGRYRYLLSREWSDGPKLTFVMLNPSTADADRDDPTIRRCIGFARRENAGGIIVVNLYAFRATRPDDLWRAENPIGGLDQERAFQRAAQNAKIGGQPVVCAWGAEGGGKSSFTVALLQSLGVRLACLGKTKDGAPRHPLYVRADQPLEPFP